MLCHLTTPIFGNSLVLLLICGSLWHRIVAGGLPIVDLGYVRQQATEYNDTLSIFTFSNIRYGQAPVGDLRWSPPLSPRPEPTLQRGETERICFQAQSDWQRLLHPWLTAWESDDFTDFYNEFPGPPALPPVPANLSQLFPPLLPSETEDCLFLDVHVPKEIFDRRGNKNESGTGSAIILWVHGGGLVLGSKSTDADFKGLVAKSRENSLEPVIVVSINYRLGAFGFLGGPALRSSGGVSNAGLLDQRLAFTWVQKNIHLFGGDARRVTVAGESAGAASIVHHITAQGGAGKPLPFHQAIIQSAGWNPTTNSRHLQTAYREFLKGLKVGTLQEARRLPSMVLRNANFLSTFTLHWGELDFGLEVDGAYVPEPPARLLLEGKFHHGIRVMMGQTAAEGVIFTSPWIKDQNSTRNFISDALPTATDAQLSFIVNSLYPPVFNSSTGLSYRSYLERAILAVSEAGVQCNSDFMARALGGKMYNYLFNVPPVFHGDDLDYAFYDGTDPNVDPAVASTFQQYLLNFVRTGNPNECGGSSVPVFEEYGPSAWTMDVKKGGFERTVNPGANARCQWWQKGFH